jgi:hypothetical protein
LYLDEDAMDSDLVNALRLRGIDVLTVREAGMVGKPDGSHLQLANDKRRALYSFNIPHFCRLHAEWMAAGRSHSGIILAQQQRFSVGEQLRRLMLLTNARSAERMKNSLEFLGYWD